MLSLLLQYPDEALLSHRDDIARAVGGVRRSYERRCLGRFMAWWLDATPTAVRQRYVATFDLQRRCGLYLSYYVDGDTRKRGMALLRLKRMYAAAGLIKEEGELPDYLPLVLEFAELAPPGYGRRVLEDYRPSLEVIRRHLHETDSPYRHLLDAVCHDLGALTSTQLAGVARLAADGPPVEHVGLLPFAPPEVMPAMEARP